MRKPAETRVPVLPAIAERWSPRAYDAAAEVTSHQLVTLLEAARWAPSFGNTQPARYLVGRRGDPTFARILATLNTGNQAWAFRAGALLIGVMVTANEKGDVPYAEYGLGLASENLVLQAVELGLIAHQMAGFSPDAVRSSFGLPDNAVPRVAIAVGHPADASVLDDERRVERELKPRQRIPLNEFAFSGEWGTPALDD
ncbi:nitroreductase family protein [Amycolatopsis sp. FDAARGOS 1241]|uniref:nitroreductase family protein n=1 Tax=Amycolatopsis sp. FDAARGOS 1241 TaxID=2778070 RepID=UPI00194E122B|nr:nitroreductase family protein [Amycolatopsis sp. FDAARGOS 1241]QRP46501.1 nitroreductase family protein [Amycolatopsis sp. FDAARGOS 1241]